MITNRIFVLFGLCALIGQMGCDSNAGEKEEESKYLVTSPLTKDTVRTVDYVCQIRSIQHIEIRSLEKGYLQRIFVDEGQLVRKGQLLFQILPTLYEAEKQRAQAEANLAEIEYENTKSLAERQIVAPNELAMAKARLDKAMAELRLSQIHLQFTEIRAPFDGIIDRFLVRQGSLVDEGDLLTNLADNTKMWVYFNVPEAEYLNYKAQVKKDSTMRVELLMANNKFFDYPGQVSTIEADFNNETGNISFRATFPNPDGLLRHGETGNIIMSVPLKKAMLIPQKCTFEILDKRYVFIIDEDNLVRSKSIIVEAELPHLYAIRGLADTDKILLEGLRKVREGHKIVTEFVQPAEAVSHLQLFAE
ncbi:MAG: efflux RND transporter periplasmic adaptor subunit [Cyclobacteriaceae bacterium]